MKITEWIIFGLITITATASQGLGAEGGTPSLQDQLNQIDRVLLTVKEDSLASQSQSKWPELEHFQTTLWRAMALDPSPIGAVPVADVPKSLFAFELNQELNQKLQNLRKSNRPRELGIEAEFSKYNTVVQNILNFRRARQFPAARAVAKRGILDQAYAPLAEKIAPSNHSPAQSIDELAAGLETLRATLDAQNPNRKNPLSGGYNFIWYTLVAMLGFGFGIFGNKLNLNFFQKLVEKIDETVPSATTHAVGNTKLDYARWLREFEEILSRLKSSQLSHERRIEEIVKNTEKLTHQSSSLAGDARIKNEANLEFRMSSLVKGLQAQLDQGLKLKSGDRVQINIMLEHCLKLCDAIEAGAIHYDRKRVQAQSVHKEPPQVGVA